MGHRYGQVFLKDQNIIRKTLDAAAVTKKDTIVEIGCGEGWFSYHLAERCKSLNIFEIDPQWVAVTQERLSGSKNVQIFLGDVLEDGLKSVKAKSFHIVANLPYYISAPLIKLFIENRARLKSATVMVQDEFAQKLVASPGSKLYTSFTLYTQFYLQIKSLFKVSRNCFRPIPKVDSRVIQIIPNKTFLDVDEALFFTLIRAAFWGRRKMLITSLAKNPYIRFKPEFKTIPFLKEHPQVRGEMLSMADYYCLYNEIKNFV